MKIPRVHADIPKKLHQAYKLACTKLDTTMKIPLIKAVNDTVKKAKGK